MDDTYSVLKRVEEGLYLDARVLRNEIEAYMEALRQSDHPLKAHNLACLQKLVDCLP